MQYKKLNINKVKILVAPLIFVLLFLIAGNLSGIFSKIDKVVVCHSTGSSSNPYIKNEPDKTADVGGHDGHNGGIFPEDPWGDIIPPFEYEGGSYPGKNWTEEGQAIWNNDCNIPILSPTPTEAVCVWVPESECSVECGGGVQDWYHRGEGCDNAYEQRECNTQPCEPTCTPPICEWSEWEECTVPCGGGIQVSYLRGDGCSNEARWQECNTQPCEPTCTPPVCTWVAESECSAECGGGVQDWYHRGEGCDNAYEQRECNTQACDEASPTPTPEDEDGDGGIGGQTESPTPTQTPTPTPTNESSSGGTNSNDDSSGSSSDSNSSTSSSDNSSSESEASVLGATTLANTGTITDIYMVLGLILTATSAYAIKTEKKKN